MLKGNLCTKETDKNEGIVIPPVLQDFSRSTGSPRRPNSGGSPGRQASDEISSGLPRDARGRSCRFHPAERKENVHIFGYNNLF